MLHREPRSGAQGTLQTMGCVGRGGHDSDSKAALVILRFLGTRSRRVAPWQTAALPPSHGASARARPQRLTSRGGPGDGGLGAGSAEARCRQKYGRAGTEAVQETGGEAEHRGGSWGACSEPSRSGVGWLVESRSAGHWAPEIEKKNRKTPWEEAGGRDHYWYSAWRAWAVHDCSTKPAIIL